MTDPHLRVFKDRSVLVKNTKHQQVFKEGKPNETAQKRLKHIKKELKKGWLVSLVEDVINSRQTIFDIDSKTMRLIERLVDSVTSEVGRAIVGLLILQATVKSLSRSQSIRLHKGGAGEFSWVDGIPMRTLDQQYITPILRSYSLLKLNAYGFMMTRSLAENYPYSEFYKAAIRGAKKEWLELVDNLEDGSVDPELVLRYMVALLANKSEKFKRIADQTLSMLNERLKERPTLEGIYEFISSHVIQSTYSARLLETAMHSLLQVMEDQKCLEGFLLPMCQMRTANKKHRNVGDIEVVSDLDSGTVIQAWDAKFGKPYLRDELEELNDKLQDRPNVEIAGFVVDREPDLREEIRSRIEEIQVMTDAKIRILSLNDWVKYWIDCSGMDEDEVAHLWVVAYVESLCQKRRERAPIDEPADAWVKSLLDSLKSGFVKPNA